MIVYSVRYGCIFVFNDTATTEIYTYGHTLSLHDALPIWARGAGAQRLPAAGSRPAGAGGGRRDPAVGHDQYQRLPAPAGAGRGPAQAVAGRDRKSTRLNSSH